MSRKECSTGKGTLYASWNPARRAEVLGQVHQETRLALSRLCSARRSDRVIEIPPTYAEPPVSIRSALSLSDSIRSTLSLSGSVGSRRPGPYPPPLSYQLVFWVQIVVHQPHTMFSTMPQLYFPPGMRSR